MPQKPTACTSIFISVLLATMISACGSSTDDGFAAPEIAPIVESSIPAALKETTSALHSAPESQNMLAGTSSDVKTYLASFFKDTYPGISGTSAKGRIKSYLKDLDSRITEINSRSKETKKTCLASTPQAYRVDGTTVDTVLDISLNVSCLDKFSGDSSGSGSGLVFGKVDNVYSIWLTLVQTNGTDSFGYFANVTKPNSDDEAADLMFVENFPSYNRQTAVRLKTKTKNKGFEMLYGSTSANIGAPTGSAVNLGCGFKMISDGTTLYFSGKVLGTGDAAVCTGATDVEACLTVSGSSVSDAASGACDTLKTQFTMSGTLLSTDFTTTTATTLTNLLKIDNASSVAATF